MIFLTPLIVLAAPAAPATVQALAGQYRLSQMEMGGALELRADGGFRYILDYGAVSEAAEGRWSIANGKVKLTSEPMNPEVLYDMERNDAKFRDQALAIDGDTLVMERYDTRMFFRRVRR
ncbi:hypothetical protein [Sphingomonas arenae]|uniref:hypothetical protein n=1 Tax=Sphingomonas arenae TaxID=2812555 RepID=UPI00196847F2|nr:hypothetical protein [Sphingomonas arenae]